MTIWHCLHAVHAEELMTAAGGAAEPFARLPNTSMPGTYAGLWVSGSTSIFLGRAARVRRT
jgi:hypothetical protein